MNWLSSWTKASFLAKSWQQVWFQWTGAHVLLQAGGEMRTKNLVKVTCLLNISQLGPLLKLEPRYFISEVSQLVCCTLAQVLLWAGGEMRTKHPGRHHTQDAQGRPYHAPYLNHTCRKQLLKLWWSRKWLRATVSTLSHPENLGARSKPCLRIFMSHL